VADAPVAEALEIPAGAPLLEVRRVVHDAGGRPVQHLRALYRPEFFQIDVTLQRTARDTWDTRGGFALPEEGAGTGE
jgi:GntR family transcriptional regulator